VSHPANAIPQVAESVFGDRAEAAGAYVRLLATAGVDRGLVGPREVDRLWDRHVLQCAVVADLIPAGARVADLGSGAGLPGLALALARPDLSIDLVEPMARRTAFLAEALAVLPLDAVHILRTRADGVARGAYDVVTARALAPLHRLVPMALPLAKPGGWLLALKGATVEAEVAAAREAIAAAGGSRPTIEQVGRGVIDPPATVVRVIHRRTAAPTGGPRRSAPRGGHVR
jgi:16S rRNA (guanine527-N7)-methyltransferase